VQCALACSYFLSGIIESTETTLIIGPIVIFPFMLLGGFFTNSNALTEWLKYVEKVSPLRYGFEAMGWN
jgi:ABC-type multidrug transport system permease subunit